MLLVDKRQRRIGTMFVWIGLVFLSIGPLLLLVGDCFESASRCSELRALDRQRAGLTFALVLPTALVAVGALRNPRIRWQAALLIVSVAWLVAGFAIGSARPAESVWVLTGVLVGAGPAAFMAVGSVITLVVARDIARR